MQQPARGQGRRAAMLDPDSGLSLTIARIVQRLKGSSLHSQLERQARVSPDLALCPQARLPFPLSLAGRRLCSRPSPAGPARAASAGVQGLPAFPPSSTGLESGPVVFIVSLLGAGGFRSEYEDYAFEISLLQIVPKMNRFVF